MQQRYITLAVLALSVTSGGFASAQLAGAPLETPAPSPANRFWWADYDADGFEDAFVLAGGSEGRLLRNLGDGTLEDVTQLAGLGGLSAASFAAWGDVDQDGRLDLVVGGPQRATQLFQGGHGGVFQDVTLISGLENEAALHAAFLDYDVDGRLDLHLGTPAASRLYRGVGAGRFESVALDLTAGALAFAAPKAGKAQAAPTLEAAPLDATPKSAATNTPRVAGNQPDTLPNGARQAVEPLTAGASGGQIAPLSGGEVIEELIPGPSCARSIEDRSNPGSCIFADTTPTLGRLYPITSNLFVSSTNGRVGMNTTAPTSRLDVDAPSDFSGNLSAVRGAGVNGPTLGHLAAQGTASFDGITTLSISGQEVGVLGVSTGGSSTDNVGVLGHSNDVGVRGEYSGDPTGTFAELGSSSGVGLTADGSSLAGDFLGAVDVAGDTTVTDGDFIVNAGAVETANLDGNDTVFGGGSQLFLNNASGTTTIELDADNGGAGQALMALRNSSGSNTMFFDSPDGGASATFTNAALSTTIELDGDSGFGGSIEMFNDAGVETVEIFSDSGGGSFISLRDANGVTRINLDGDSAGGAFQSMLAADSSTTLVFDADSTNNGGEISIRNDISQETIELIGDESSDSGQITMWDRQASPEFISIELDARDSAGTGSELILRDADGTVTIDFDGQNGAGGSTTGQIQVNEADGSIAFRFLGADLNLYNAAGIVTQSYDRLTGTKSAVVDLPSYGNRLFYAMESPEVWFEDFGSGQLANGVARIDLDPMFLEGVVISQEHPMKVFITLTDDSEGIYVQKGADHFVVRERKSGTGNASFDWRVVGKRSGLELHRLELHEDGGTEVTSDGDFVELGRLPSDGPEGEPNQPELAPVLPQSSDGGQAGAVRQAKPRPTAPKSTRLDPVVIGAGR